MGTMTVQLFIIRGLVETRNNFQKLIERPRDIEHSLLTKYIASLECLSQMLLFTLEHFKKSPEESGLFN